MPAHIAVKHIVARVFVTPPAHDNSPMDKLGLWANMPGTPILYRTNDITDDAKFNLGGTEVALLLARGDIR